MTSHFSKRSYTYFGLAMRPECPRAGKIGEASPAGYIHGEAVKGCPRTSWHNCIFGLTWSRPGVKPAELHEIAVDRETLRVLLQLLPTRLSYKRKWAPQR